MILFLKKWGRKRRQKQPPADVQIIGVGTPLLDGANTWSGTQPFWLEPTAQQARDRLEHEAPTRHDSGPTGHVRHEPAAQHHHAHDPQPTHHDVGHSHDHHSHVDTSGSMGGGWGGDSGGSVGGGGDP